MVWSDRLPRNPLDPAKVKQETGVETVKDWIEFFKDIELPEPFAIVDVIDRPGWQEACEALRALKRNPTLKNQDDQSINFRLWNINPVLNQIAQLTNPKTVLDLGCGAGRDAVWLAANGWDVTAVDRLSTNIDRIKKLRGAHAPNDSITFILANLNETQLQNRFDLVLLHYCWDPNYFELAKKSVKPNGLLSVLAHSKTHRSCFGNPRESKILNPKEIDTNGFETVIEREFWSQDRHAVSIVLRRLAPNQIQF